MKLNVFILIMWIIVGICQLISCATGADARWVSYWLCYTILIISLVQICILDE